MTDKPDVLDPFDFCAALAATLPCRVVGDAEDPYLSRYTFRAHDDGSYDYLHFFHRGDADRELHNHPWSGTSLILAGGYTEERRRADDSIALLTYRPGDTNVLAPDTFHRVDLIDPRGCWTLFRVGAKQQSWGFWDRDTHVFTPWRELLRARGRDAEAPWKEPPGPTNEADHVVISGDSFVCQRCGARELLKLPIEIDDIVARARTFTAAHVGCPASTPAAPLNPGAGPAFTRSMLKASGAKLHGCGACYECVKKTPTPPGQLPLVSTVMICCPICGNKRCPHATHHVNACTNSNEPGQHGSRYQ